MERRFLAVFFISMMLLFRFSVVGLYADGELSLHYAGDTGIDANGNGFFDYLRVLVEANISIPGTYTLELQSLVDSSGISINASANTKLTLEEGEQVVTILLDGRTIHSSGRNPVNISYVGLVSENYGVAGFLYDIPLAREYKFSEFEPQPSYNVGVKKGDWVEYSALRLSSSDLLGQQPSSYSMTVVTRVEEIQEKLVYLDFAFVSPTGETSIDKVSGYLEKESSVFPFVIPANLTVGDRIAHLTNSTINGTRSENVLGNLREVNYFRDESTTSQHNVTLLLRQAYTWDRRTGFLVSSWMNMTLTDLSAGYRSYTNISFTLSYSNVILQKSTIVLEAAPSIKLGSTLNITATIQDSYKRIMVNKEIVFQLADRSVEIGKGTTTYNGTKIQYTPDKSGKYLIKASFNGTEELSATESIIEVSVTSDTDYTMLILIPVVAAVLILGSALYVNRRRRTRR